MLSCSANFAMKGASLEASFLLEVFGRFLDPKLGSYKVTARTGTFNNNRIAIPNSGDNTETKKLTFALAAQTGVPLRSQTAPSELVARDSLKEGDALPLGVCRTSTALLGGGFRECARHGRFAAWLSGW